MYQLLIFGWSIAVVLDFILEYNAVEASNRIDFCLNCKYFIIYITSIYVNMCYAYRSYYIYSYIIMLCTLSK